MMNALRVFATLVLLLSTSNAGGIISSQTRYIFPQPKYEFSQMSTVIPQINTDGLTWLIEWNNGTLTQNNTAYEYADMSGSANVNICLSNGDSISDGDPSDYLVSFNGVNQIATTNPILAGEPLSATTSFTIATIVKLNGDNQDKALIGTYGDDVPEKCMWGLNINFGGVGTTQNSMTILHADAGQASIQRVKNSDANAVTQDPVDGKGMVIFYEFAFNAPDGPTDNTLTDMPVPDSSLVTMGYQLLFGTTDPPQAITQDAIMRIAVGGQRFETASPSGFIAATIGPVAFWNKLLTYEEKLQFTEYAENRTRWTHP